MRYLRAQSQPVQPKLAATAAAQGGPFSTAQAMATGYTRNQIQHLVRSRQWIALRRGVFVARDLVEVCGDLDGPRHELAVAAAIVAVGHAVASHESAARFFRLPLLATPEWVTLTGQRSETSGRSRLPGIKIHRADLPDEHRCRSDGIPLTTPARTVTDLARTLPFRQGVVIADAALRAGIVTLPGLRRVGSDCGRWPGIGQARQVVDFADPKAESALESIGRVVFAEQGLPPPETQVSIVIGPGVVARVDFLWKRQRTIAETDGMMKYTDASVLRREKLRQEALADLGYEVVRITWQQLHEDPAEVAARLRRAFAHAGARRAARSAAG
jgi:Protein of unknown function (DUF559)